MSYSEGFKQHSENDLCNVHETDTDTAFTSWCGEITVGKKCNRRRSTRTRIFLASCLPNQRLSGLGNSTARPKPKYRKVSEPRALTPLSLRILSIVRV